MEWCYPEIPTNRTCEDLENECELLTFDFIFANLASIKSLMGKLFLILLFLISFTCSAQSFTDSNLPIVIINTDGGAVIMNNPRVLATMKIINRGEGSRNYVSDQNTTEYLDYNGRIEIEIRGSSSQFLPKKQYGFSTLKADNVTNDNISLLGFPADNDWVLNGLGFDPSLMRDYLCYNLSRRIGQYASRTVYCEVMINNAYVGLYVLQEKVKQGAGRVDVTKIGSADITFPNVTGGYITKADKPNGDPVAWRLSSHIGLNDVTFIHELPKPGNVKKEQNDYIRQTFVDLSTVAASGNNSLVTGIPSIIDIASFVDFIIISEFSANADAYQFSTFFHKDRNGKLRAGPVWDMNLTFGYDLAIWGFNRSKTDTWQFSNGDNEGAAFWRDLYNNTEFQCSLSKRWNELTQPGKPLNYASMNMLIDSTAEKIKEASVRENTRWSTVGNLYNHIPEIKNFILHRIEWMNTKIASVEGCRVNEAPPLVISRIMYNPPELSNETEFIEIFNTGDKEIDMSGMYFPGTGITYQFPPYSVILPGAKKIIAGNVNEFFIKYGFLPSDQFTRKLSNEGMDLILADGFGNIIDRVKYSPYPPWPDVNNNGKYLELADPRSDNGDPLNWIASGNILVSSEEPIADPDPEIFPNPVSDFLRVRSGGNIISLLLTDIYGNSKMNFTPDNLESGIDVSSLTKGIYLLRICTNKKCVVSKVVKE